jgi:hypothetical protein
MKGKVSHFIYYIVNFGVWTSFLPRGDISPTLHTKLLWACIHFFHLVANELFGILNKYIIDRLWHSYWPTKVVSLILFILNMGFSIGSWLLYMGINVIFEVCHDLIIENPQHYIFILYLNHYVTYLIQSLE